MATVALSGIITPTNVVTATSTTTLTNKTLTAPTIASANLTTALTLTGAAGTSGQVLTSGGSGVAPTWTTASGGSSQWTTSGSDIYYTTGKVGIGTSTFTSGGGKLQVSDGITFPSTQSASSDANTLDDYEEGTWTPVVSSSGGTITTYSSSGKYTKIGRSVTLSFTTTITTPGTASGTMRIDSFPFTDGNSMQIPTLSREETTGIAYQAFKRAGDTAGHIRTLTETSISWTAGVTYSFGLTYFV